MEIQGLDASGDLNKFRPVDTSEPNSVREVRHQHQNAASVQFDDHGRPVDGSLLQNAQEARLPVAGRFERGAEPGFMCENSAAFSTIFFALACCGRRGCPMGAPALRPKATVVVRRVHDVCLDESENVGSGMLRAVGSLVCP